MNSKFTQVVAMVLILGALAGCSQSEEKKIVTAGGSGSSGQDEVLKPVQPPKVPDHSSGHDSIPGLLYGRWYVDFQGQNMSMRMVFEVSSQSIQVTNTCYFPQGLHPVSAMIEVPAAYTSSEINIQRGDQKETIVEQGGGPTRCRVAAEAGTTFYQIKGNTLHFTSPGSSDELVLTRY